MIRIATERVHRLIHVLALVLVCAGLCGTTAQAQRGGKDDADIPQKDSALFLAAFHDVVAQPSRSTVRVLCDNQEAALGAIVGADGWIVTKASELKGKIICRLRDGRERPAVLVGVSEPYDLAMLKIEANDLAPVLWRDSKHEKVGNWLATSGPSDVPIAVGVLSVGTRTITGPELARRSNSGGFLGIRIAPVKNGVKVAEVIPKSAASKAGFEADDVIIAISGKPVSDSDALFKALQKLRPGQIVHIRVRREDEELELKAKLDKRPMDRSDFQNQMGGKLSERRTGFPEILQHDTVLRPSDCGGPVVDLEGKVVGINIARAGRTETYAIPSEVVKPLLKDLKSGKLAPPK
jgi:serine protease Do